MNMEKLSSLWIELQKSNRLPRSSLTSSCQDELQELMKQLDIMVNSKKQEWQRQLEMLQSKLDLKDKEYRLQKATAEQKGKEVEELRSQLEGGNKTQKEIVTEYEEQLAALRSEVQKMKREYEKLYRRYTKQTKEIDKQKTDQRSSDSSDHSLQIKSLVEKNEELHHRCKDLELEKRNLIKQIETLEVQNRGLVEKCDFIQQQSETYQSQLDRRRQMQDNTELNLKGRIAQLESQIHRYKTVITVQKEKIEKLKSALNEALNSHKRAMSDNEKLLEDLRKSNSAIRRLEGENSQLVSDIQSKNDLLRVAEEDTNQYSKDVSRLEQTISAKDDIIRNIGDSNRKEESEQINLLKQSNHELKEENRSYKKFEKKLKIELTQSEEKFHHVLKSNEEILEKLRQKEDEIDYIKKKEIGKLQTQIEKLQEEKETLHGNHRAELSGMRLRLSKLTTELHHRDVTMATMSEKSSGMEKQLRDETEACEKRIAELQVSNAQVEALRLENKHLRQEFINKLGDVYGKAEAEKQLNSLNTEYGQTIYKLEKENGELKHDVSVLKNEISELEKKFSERLEKTNNFAAVTLHQLRSEDTQELEKVMINNDLQITQVSNQVDSTIHHYDVQMDLLRAQKKRLEEDLHNQKRENMRLMNEMSQPLITSGHGKGDMSFLTTTESTNMSLCSKSDFGDLMGRLLSENLSKEIAERFLQEEKKRTQALEELIDTHIAEYRQGSEGTIHRYSMDVSA